MNKAVGFILVFIAALSWSTAGLFTRVVSTDIPTTLFWRSFTGGLCVLAVYMILRRTANIRKLFQFGVGEAVMAVVNAIATICFISSFFYTTIANVVFVSGTMPLITFVLAMIFLKEKLTLITTIACLLSAVGVMFIMWGAQNFGDIIGLALAFGMTTFLASLTVAVKYYPKADMVKATYLAAFLGALLVAPFATFGETSTSDYQWLFLYGFVNVGLGFAVYLVGVSKITAVAAALISLLEVLLAPIWAAWLFNEELGQRTIVGGGVILFATIMYLTVKERKIVESTA